MENATDAIIMAFAVLVFVVALSIAMVSFTQVRQTTAAVTEAADSLEYYTTIALEDANSITASSSRVVGVETVIPTLYRYYKENYTIVFYVGQGYNSSKGTFTSITPMTLYYTETSDTNLEKTSLSVQVKDNSGNNTRAVFGFDKQEEQTRQEPWNSSQETDYNFINSFVNGVTTEKYYTSKTSSYNGSKNLWPSKATYIAGGNGPYYQIYFYFNGNKFTGASNDGLIGQSYKFVERYGEYNYENTIVYDDDDEVETVTSDLTESVVVLDNGEIVSSNTGTTKRVIQYIYIASESTE